MGWMGSFVLLLCLRAMRVAGISARTDVVTGYGINNYNTTESLQEICDP